MTITNLGYPEVKYGRPPLDTVVCALRFNPILKIAQGIPADFQDRVRQVFPKFSQQEGVEVQIALGEASVVPIPAVRQVPGAWRFQTEDELWTAALTIEALSLETRAYSTFPDFEERFALLCRALRDVYEVDHFIRVGLRYINILRSEALHGGWVERFNAFLLGAMADPQIGDSVVDAKQLFVVQGDDWMINVRHGTEGSNYRLDIDHATETAVPAGEVEARLRDFNDRAYQIFRWAISDKLHAEMEPMSHE